jgi:predicted membrane protein
MCDDEKSSSGSSSKCANAVSIAARITGMGLAVASAALMATASQCTIYAAPGARPRTITYRDYAPFVYVYMREHFYATLTAPLYTRPDLGCLALRAGSL